jgi:hypothetical protein
VSVKGLRHVRERISLSVLALSFCFHMRICSDYYRAFLRDRGPEPRDRRRRRRRRRSAAHNYVDSVIQHFGHGGDDILENK